MSDPAKKNEISQELFDNGPEQTSVQIRIPRPVESELIRKILGNSRLWAQDTVIVDLASEAIEAENPQVIEFRTSVHTIISSTYLAPAWEYLKHPLNQEIRENLEHTRNYAILYSHKLFESKYANHIDLTSVTQIVNTLTSGDWFSKEGLMAISTKIRAVLLSLPTNI